MKSEFPLARIFSSDELHVGLTADFEREISVEDIATFARLSGDANPLHVDSVYAIDSGYQARVVHGAFQVSLASCLIGMSLPGRDVLLGSVNARFPLPLYYPCRVIVTGEVTSWNRQSQTGSLKVNVRNAESQIPTSEIFLTFTLREQREIAPILDLQQTTPVHPKTDRRIVLVTGASGGLGAALVAELSTQYYVLAMTGSRALNSRLQANPNVFGFEGNLQSSTWEDQLASALQEQRLYGAVHAAWPGAPHGSLLQTDERVMEQQLSFGTSKTVGLARFLAAHADPLGGRLVVLGSIYATGKPILNMATYSLGKAALEHTVRLLAPELAIKKITVNVVSPSFVAAGMNQQTSDRQRIKETAMVPMGRLCREEDINAMVRYLLSPEASFVSGQVIGLYGGQL